MFNCGPPSAFLCKFTTHNFFVSSVLKVSQHSYDLSQWGNQVKHEEELAQLRNTDVNGGRLSSTSVPVEQNSFTVTPALPTASEKSDKTESRCHHYQFQCLNNSECIAIYNVCDGIPQCPDGSDESNELKCPIKGISKDVSGKVQKFDLSHHSENKAPNSAAEIRGLQPSTMLTNPQNSPISPPHDKQKPRESKEDLMHKEEAKVPWHDRSSELQGSRPDYYHHVDESDGLGSPFIHKHSQFVAANDPHVQSLNHWSNDYDQYPQHSASLDQRYNPYESNYQRMDDQYLPNPLSPEYDSVKGYGNYRQDDIPYWPGQDGVQDGAYSVDDFPQPGLHSLNKQNGYPDKDIYTQQISRAADQYASPKHHIVHKPLDVMPAVQQSRSSELEDYKSRRFPLQRQQPYLNYDESLQRSYANYPEVKPKNYEPAPNMDDVMYSNDDLIRASIVNQLPIQTEDNHHSHEQNLKHIINTPMPHIHKKIKEKTSERKNSAEDDSLIIVKPTSHSKGIQRTVLDFKMSVTELYQSTRTHTRETNSAILALVMGLTATVLLFILLACRMKTIRRRMSRKGRGLAHDADYLVNGMYL
ncbi:uncharacterized protein LOC118203428 isoform X2 [Stegodyphus dumicola]|nr:uncharacterized protein LOC118203428 isoform X2 [Stegodyphus dumicola]